MSTFLLTFAPYVVPVLVAFLTPIVTYAINQIITHMPANQRALVSSAIQTGVTAAEQMTSSSLNGSGKKQVALEIIEKQLAAWNINVNPTVVSALIEEAVYALNQSQSTPTTPAPAPVQALTPSVVLSSYPDPAATN